MDLSASLSSNTSVPTQEGLLAGRAALVLGASRGIGAATARAFGRAGAKVVLAAGDTVDLDHVVDGIRTAGGTAMWIRADVRDPNGGRVHVWVA